MKLSREDIKQITDAICLDDASLMVFIGLNLGT